MDEITLTFEMDGETKNCWRYKESKDSNPSVFGTLYLRKIAVEGRAPSILKVVLKDSVE